MNPQDPTIQPLNHSAMPPAPLAPPHAAMPPAPQFHPQPTPTQPPAQPQPAHRSPDPLGLSTPSTAHIPAPHGHASQSDHAGSNPAPDHLPHIAPVTASNRPMLVTLSVAALFISLVGTFILYFTNVSTKSRIKETEQAIAELNGRLETPPLSVTNEKLTIVNRALAGYKTATAGKIDYQKFFEGLPKQTPKDMRISALSVDSTGGVRISATGTSFDTAGKSLLSLARETSLLDLNLESIGLSGSKEDKSVTFELSAKLDTAKLLVTPSTAPSSTANPSGDASTSTP